jgi:ribosomal protein S12 methylthiotransferase RimO
VTTRISLVTLGCARNDLDSEELAARFEAAGLTLVDEPASADAVVVNTCGFVEAAKKDSIDTVLAAADLKGDGGPRAVVAVGCLAERYGDELSAVLPEADAVLGFDAYPDLADTVVRVLAGERPVSHRPQDRRQLLPVTPADRHAPTPPPDGPASVGPGPRAWRRRLDGGPVAPLRLASGCDRRCSFCAIPRFRGAFVSRPPAEVLAEARWLADRGVREVFCVSENSTSYGKDLADLRLLEAVLPQLAAVPGIERVRVSYLQPAEMRPSLVEVMTSTAGVVPYFDLSFQHASGRVLRRMRRFGDGDRFLELVGSIRARCPEAGLRSNVIVGFPGEDDADLEELERFLVEARLDVVGVFGYSDEDGTPAESLAGKLDRDEIDRRQARVTRLVDELCAQRAEDRVGQQVQVLVERAGADVEGRAAHQGPEVDGSTTVTGCRAEVGTVVAARVVGTDGVDLVAEGVR